MVECLQRKVVLIKKKKDVYCVAQAYANQGDLWE